MSGKDFRLIHLALLIIGCTYFVVAMNDTAGPADSIQTNFQNPYVREIARKPHPVYTLIPKANQATTTASVKMIKGQKKSYGKKRVLKQKPTHTAKHHRRTKSSQRRLKTSRMIARKKKMAHLVLAPTKLKQSPGLTSVPVGSTSRPTSANSGMKIALMPKEQ